MMSEELKTASAYLSSVKSSPLKILKIARYLQGKNASHAIRDLQFSNLKLSPIFKSLINSAIANAENNHGMDADNLLIHKIDIGKSFTLKRFATRARGRSTRILKRFSKIRVVLVENLN